jgi:catechol 2,3-dioxygenase-like lactoylglutathione lyase family enzyme
VGNEFRSSRDVIVRTDAFDEAAKFYGATLGFPVTHQGDSLIGFETGEFCVYIEKGRKHGPVFEFLVRDVEAAKAKLLAAGCTIEEEDASVPRCYMRDPYGLVFNVGQATAET